MTEDHYRANRQFERFFGYKGPDYLMNRQESSPQGSLPPEEEQLIATIIYDHENQKVETVHHNRREEKE